nr:WAS/WASL-interacting protein family member 3-like [Chlorocebus sabaeus]
MPRLSEQKTFPRAGPTLRQWLAELPGSPHSSVPDSPRPYILRSLQLRRHRGARAAACQSPPPPPPAPPGPEPLAGSLPLLGLLSVQPAGPTPLSPHPGPVCAFLRCGGNWGEEVPPSRGAQRRSAGASLIPSSCRCTVRV